MSTLELRQPSQLLPSPSPSPSPCPGNSIRKGERTRARERARARLGDRAGFTLIEILAVLLILSILIAVLVTNLYDADAAGKIKVAENRLRMLQAAIEHYESENGGAPPSSFQPGQEVPNDGLNVGIEALVVTLWSKKYEAGGLLDDIRDGLINSDGDRSTKQLTDFETRDLLEVPDPWDNPIAYIERNDYGVTNRRYSTFERDSEQQIESVPLAYKNPTTGQYFAAGGFQLISAGPDGRFATEDDITNFDRQQ